MLRYLTIPAAVVLLQLGGPAALPAQTPTPSSPIVDSIAVEGNARLTPSQIVGTAGIVVKQPINPTLLPTGQNFGIPFGAISPVGGFSSSDFLLNSISGGIQIVF